MELNLGLAQQDVSDGASDGLHPHHFTGRWIGETQRCAMPAHIWEISQRGNSLLIATRWEGETEVATFVAQLVSNEPAFIISGKNSSKGILIDRQHFVIAAWCTNDKRGGDGPAYDVVFSRPGIAELTAHQTYTQYLERFVQTGN